MKPKRKNKKNKTTAIDSVQQKSSEADYQNSSDDSIFIYENRHSKENESKVLTQKSQNGHLIKKMIIFV